MIGRLPSWFRQEIPDSGTIEMMRLFCEAGVHTVCREARCPNITHCFKERKVTFMILGRLCSRSCGFCAVKMQDKTGLAPDPQEPERIAELVKRLGLEYVVITSVTRDDLSDGGARHFARTVNSIRSLNPQIKIELLIPDFQGNEDSIRLMADVRPSVLAHNLETVERLYPELRPLSDYYLSLEVLKKIKMYGPSLTTKSSLMLGFGEKEEEVVKAMEDLRKSDCDILTLGQYLSPSLKHYRVREFLNPQQFNNYRRIGISLGFKAVSSGPLVRSSYGAEDLYQELNYA
jgi:lipoic acid synthetase